MYKTHSTTECLMLLGSYITGYLPELYCRSQAIIHAGGMLADATLAQQTLQGLRTVLAPKTLSAARLQSYLLLHPMASQVCCK